MNDPNWKPDPQLLAAYFDGELESRDDDLRARLEVWLEQHPEAADERAKHRQLQKLMLDTTPAEPSLAVWNQVLDQIDARRRQPIALPTSKRSWWSVGIVAASIALVFALWFGALRSRLQTDAKHDPVVVAPKAKPVEVFLVATENEVVVLHIEGRDISTVVVGTLPVRGLLELAAPGDVHVFHTRPAASDQMVPNVDLKGPSAPLIWAKLETD
jgi:anti-sigma factor RsiW